MEAKDQILLRQIIVDLVSDFMCFDVKETKRDYINLFGYLAEISGDLNHISVPFPSLFSACYKKFSSIDIFPWFHWLCYPVPMCSNNIIVPILHWFR